MAESNVAAAPKETQQSAKPTRKGSLLSRVAYSFGNVGQSAFYNALSTYFIVYVTSSLFSGARYQAHRRYHRPCGCHPYRGDLHRSAAGQHHR